MKLKYENMANDGVSQHVTTSIFFCIENFNVFKSFIFVFNRMSRVRFLYFLRHLPKEEKKEVEDMNE